MRQDTRWHRVLQFDDNTIQSQMSKRDPYALVLDYTRAMMAFVLFQPRPARIGIVGLGGGSLAKFCYRELGRCRIDAAEIDAQVVAMRQDFMMPADGPRFAVHIEDGADFVARHEDSFDVLLLDAYDTQGIPAKLSTARFYRQCRRALRPNGVLVANLYRTRGDTHLKRIERAFGMTRVLVDDSLKPNRVVFAYAGDLKALRARAESLDIKRMRPEAWAQIRDDVWRVAQRLSQE